MIEYWHWKTIVRRPPRTVSLPPGNHLGKGKETDHLVKRRSDAVGSRVPLCVGGGRLVEFNAYKI